ncbi:MAG: hypothetical protein ACYDH9_10500 [Limisphaerales bacterium]
MSAPTLSNAALIGQTFSVTLESQTGQAYTLESVSDRSATNWTAVQSVTGTGGWITLTDTNASTSARFYRVRAQ